MKSLRVVEGVAATADRPVVRRLLGEVEVADDGSYQVQIPANTPVQLELLDASGTALRTSAWLWVRNHAAQGCVGCHEDPERTPPNRLMKALSAPAPVLEPAAREAAHPLRRARRRAAFGRRGPRVRPVDRRRRTAMRRRLTILAGTVLFAASAAQAQAPAVTAPAGKGPSSPRSPRSRASPGPAASATTR